MRSVMPVALAVAVVGRHAWRIHLDPSPAWSRFLRRCTLVLRVENALTDLVKSRGVLRCVGFVDDWRGEVSAGGGKIKARLRGDGMR